MDQKAQKHPGMRCDWFHHTEKRNFDKDADADAEFTLEIHEGASLEEILAAGYAKGFPKGSARAGVYEIQTDEGIWTSPTRGRLNPHTAVFKTWEQLEAEERGDVCLVVPSTEEG